MPVHETSQSFCCRFNHHGAAELKMLRHFNSDGHRIDDLTIKPIENSDDNRLDATRLSREEY